jgi:hypothetical protein
MLKPRGMHFVDLVCAFFSSLDVVSYVITKLSFVLLIKYSLKETLRPAGHPLYALQTPLFLKPLSASHHNTQVQKCHSSLITLYLRLGYLSEKLGHVLLLLGQRREVFLARDIKYALLCLFTRPDGVGEPLLNPFDNAFRFGSRNLHARIINLAPNLSELCGEFVDILIKFLDIFWAV